MITNAKLLELIAGINANYGVINCAHCALRADEYFAANQNLRLGPVSVEDAYLKVQNLIKIRPSGKRISASISDQRILDKCTPPPKEFKILHDLVNDFEYYIDLDEVNKREKSLRLTPVNFEDLANRLSQLSHRALGGYAHGFIFFIRKDGLGGHIANFYVDSGNDVFLIDAQSGRVYDCKTDMSTIVHDHESFNLQLHYIQTIPAVGYNIHVKAEKFNIKQEKSKFASSYPNPTTSFNMVEVLLKNGINALHTRDFKTAYQYFQQAFLQDVSNAMVHSQLGLCYKSGKGTQQNPRLAFYHFSRSIELEKSDLAYHNRGLCYKTGFGTPVDHYRAFQDFRSAAELNTNNAATWQILGLYYKNGVTNAEEPNPILAFGCFYSSIQLNPTCSEVWQMLAECYRFGFGVIRNDDQAFYCAQQAVQCDPNNAAAHTVLAACYQESIGTPCNLILAKIHFENAVQIAPNFKEYWEKLSKCYTQLSNFALNNVLHIQRGNAPDPLPVVATASNKQATSLASQMTNNFPIHGPTALTFGWNTVRQSMQKENSTLDYGSEEKISSPQNTLHL